MKLLLLHLVVMAAMSAHALPARQAAVFECKGNVGPAWKIVWWDPYMSTGDIFGEVEAEQIGSKASIKGTMNCFGKAIGPNSDLPQKYLAAKLTCSSQSGEVVTHLIVNDEIGGFIYHSYEVFSVWGGKLLKVDQGGTSNCSQSRI
ncbi:MAG: hypothetical protein NDI61_05760 [Bdellovibrionaceae bacterium]|nr:hypothetical protein [Pseudobdellovibrionaceae bacterium]